MLHGKSLALTFTTSFYFAATLAVKPSLGLTQWLSPHPDQFFLLKGLYSSPGVE